MELVTPFAQTPSSPEPIIAQVRRQLADDDRVGARVPTGVLDRVADQAVRELWSSRVKTFVPVLALRTARELLRDQDVLITVGLPMMRNGEEALAVMPRAVERTPQDIIHIESDVLPFDDRDRLPL
ncbi:MAG TPA: hypothetical protein VFY70_12730 [Thermomicrobiales bacterium]|nr:hypothetical protein [Thermomicrobiales bacterium]